MRSPRRILLIVCFCLLSLDIRAEWTATTRATNYYTTDASLFSATQRLSRDADPTQPALDTRLTGQGSDGVLETLAQIGNSIQTDWGKTSFDVRGDGYVFYRHTRYSNGNIGAQIKQDFSSKTSLMIRYYLNPNLFLGDNVSRQPGFIGLSAEQVTSQIVAMHVGHEITDDLEVKIFTRFGTRRYDQAFKERNTDFWTVGPHAEFRISPWIKLGLAYHFEKGISAGRVDPLLNDDVSYINNFAAADLELELDESWVLSFAFDYEHNKWLSQFPEDDRYRAYEQVFLGEALLRFKLDDSFSLHGGIQQGSRKMNVESSSVSNTNVGFGLKGIF